MNVSWILNGCEDGDVREQQAKQPGAWLPLGMDHIDHRLVEIT